jgi:integrase
MYVRAIMDEKVPAGYNPVAMWGRTRPKGKPREAHWLEVHEAALLMEACRTYRPERSDVAIGDLHALVATSLLTGGRPAEIRGLAIADVSFARKTVTFRPNEHRRLKTAGSARTVPLFPQLEQILSEYLHGPNKPKGKLLFPSSHRRVRGGDERMLGDLRTALDTVAVQAGWAAGEVRPYAFRHSFCAARLQTLDRGAPVSIYTVARELGHGGESLVKNVYGHIGDVRARGEFVEYRPEIVEEIQDEKIRRDFENRFKKVARVLKLVAA